MKNLRDIRSHDVGLGILVELRAMNDMAVEALQQQQLVAVWKKRLTAARLDYECEQPPKDSGIYGKEVGLAGDIADDVNRLKTAGLGSYGQGETGAALSKRLGDLAMEMEEKARQADADLGRKLADAAIDTNNTKAAAQATDLSSGETTSFTPDNPEGE